MSKFYAITTDVERDEFVVARANHAPADGLLHKLGGNTMKTDFGLLPAPRQIERLAGAYKVSLERPDGLSDLLRAFLSDAPAVAKPMRRRPGRRAEVKQLEALVGVVESIRTGKEGEIKDCQLRVLAQNCPRECKATAMAIFGFLATDPSSPWNDQEAASLKNAYYRFKRSQREENIVVTSMRFVSMVSIAPRDY